MKCELAQELILELAQRDTELSSHLAGCEACRSFLALQQSLDAKLAEAYRAPALSPGFRAGVRARITKEKRKQRGENLRALIAPGAGLATSGLCALAAPDMAMFFSDSPAASCTARR